MEAANAGPQARRTAGATQERTLLGVGSTALFGVVWVRRAALAFLPPCSGHLTHQEHLLRPHLYGDDSCGAGSVYFAPSRSCRGPSCSSRCPMGWHDRPRSDGKGARNSRPFEPWHRKPRPWFQAAVVLWFLHQGGEGAQLTRHIQAGAAEDNFSGATRLEVGEARSQITRRAGKGQSLRVSHRHVGAVVLVHFNQVLPPSFLHPRG
jgi:hypothetical protein